VKIDLFNEIQDPRPWAAGHEQQRFQQAIEQAKLADELGYGCWWQVGHHGAEEFSPTSIRLIGEPSPSSTTTDPTPRGRRRASVGRSR